MLLSPTGALQAAVLDANSKGVPERDTEAALARSNAPANRIPQQPSNGLMASGLRQYEPVNMPVGRPSSTSDPRIFDPNDSYGWRNPSNAAHGYYSEIAGNRLPPGSTPYDSYAPQPETTNGGWFGIGQDDTSAAQPPSGLLGGARGAIRGAISGAAPPPTPTPTPAPDYMQRGASHPTARRLDVPQAPQAPQAPVIGPNDMFSGGSPTFDESAGGQSIPDLRNRGGSKLGGAFPGIISQALRGV
jgi:hypothetical protein